MSVDLPAPFSPSSATISHRPTSIPASASACVPPNCLHTPRIDRSGCAGAEGSTRTSKSYNEGGSEYENHGRAARRVCRLRRCACRTGETGAEGLHARNRDWMCERGRIHRGPAHREPGRRSEEHTSELESRVDISHA